MPYLNRCDGTFRNQIIREVLKYLDYAAFVRCVFSFRNYWLVYKNTIPASQIIIHCVFSLVALAKETDSAWNFPLV